MRGLAKARTLAACGLGSLANALAQEDVLQSLVGHTTISPMHWGDEQTTGVGTAISDFFGLSLEEYFRYRLSV